MMTKQDIFILSLLAVAACFSFFFSIFLTDINIYFTTIFLIIASTLVSFLISSETKDRLKKKLIKSFSSKEAYFVYMIFGTHMLWGIFQGDYFFELHRRMHWLNTQIIFEIPLFYFTTKFFITIIKELHMNSYTLLRLITSLISVSYAIDWVYSLYKGWDSPEYRWNGSSGNPNIWAVQSSLVLILILYSYLKTYLKPNFFSAHRISPVYYSLTGIGILISLIGLIKAFSLANFLALIAFATALGLYFLFKTKSKIFIQIACILLSVAMIYFIKNTYLIDIETIKLPLAKKFIPRIKLWSNIDELLASFSWLQYIFGLGHLKYKAWLDSLGRNDFYHAHNFFYHFFIQFGLIGFLSSTWLYLRMLFSKHLIYYLLGVYILIVSLFDISLFFDEVQILFFILLAFYESHENESEL